MLNRWDCENLIGYESVPCNVKLIKVMEDYHLDEGVVKYTLHLTIIILPLGNEGHIGIILVKIVGHIEHFDSFEMHK